MKKKKINFREIELKPKIKVILGRNDENNDMLMKKFKGKENIILHTVAPGSPFCVIEKLNPSKEIIASSGVVVAKYSQEWRNSKKDIDVNVFTGKDISKPLFSKKGTWKVKKLKKIKIKKKDILKFERKNAKNK